MIKIRTFIFVVCPNDKAQELFYWLIYKFNVFFSSFHLQMSRPMQVKPADTDSNKGGEDLRHDEISTAL